MEGKKTIPAAARQASVRALIVACATVVAYALAHAVEYALDYYNVCCCQSQFSFVLRCVELTAAAAAERRSLWLAMLCCAVLQAAVAALALRLPCRRRALAYLELAVTIVRHCMYARAVLLLLAADPGYLFGKICIGCIFCFAARDLASFSLLLGGEK